MTVFQPTTTSWSFCTLTRRMSSGVLCLRKRMPSKACRSRQIILSHSPIHHSLAPSFTHSFARSLAHSFTQLAHSVLTPSITYLLYSFMHSLAHWGKNPSKKLNFTNFPSGCASFWGEEICVQKFRSAYQWKELEKWMPHFKSTFPFSEIKCPSQMMCTFLSHTRVCSVIVCIMFCLTCVETKSRFSICCIHRFNDFALTWLLPSKQKQKLQFQAK